MLSPRTIEGYYDSCPPLSVLKVQMDFVSHKSWPQVKNIKLMSAIFARKKGKKKKEKKNSASREWTYEYINTHGSHLYMFLYTVSSVSSPMQMQFYCRQNVFAATLHCVTFLSISESTSSWSNVIHTMSNQSSIDQWPSFDCGFFIITRCASTHDQFFVK